MMSIKFQELSKKLVVAKFQHNENIDWQSLSTLSFISITKTDKEISVITYEHDLPQDLKNISNIENDWVGFRVKGTLDFNQYGILNSILKPLSEAKISVFVFSTYDTDYILVKSKFSDFIRKNYQVEAFR